MIGDGKGVIYCTYVQSVGIIYCSMRFSPANIRSLKRLHWAICEEWLMELNCHSLALPEQNGGLAIYMACMQD